MSGVAWSDQDPFPGKNEPLRVLPQHQGLLSMMQDLLNPESGWRLGFLTHCICPERCCQGLGLDKGQLSLQIPARLSPLPTLGFRNLPKWWEEKKG